MIPRPFHRLAAPARAARSLRPADAAVVLALLLASLGATPAGAATITVGAGPGCQHAALQAAIDAAEASAGADAIHVSRSAAYTQQALSVSTGQELELVGGFATCADSVPDGSFTVLDGAGGATEPVLRVTLAAGGVARLRYLAIRNGDEDGTGKGGGIYYRGNGSVQISDSAITGNLAGHGGGIYAEGTGSDSEMLIGANVTIAGNTARYNGGGVFAEALEFAMREPNTIIAFNEAQGTDVNGVPFGGFGGGLVVNPTTSLAAFAYVAGTGSGTLGVVYGNTARYGGGIAVLGENGSRESARLDLFSIDPARQVAVKGNFASVAGGALYVSSDGDSFPDLDFSFANARLWNAVLEGNAAPAGAAVYVASDELGDGMVAASFLEINRTRPVDAAACPVGSACGGVLDNVAQDVAAQPTDGAVIHVEESSSARVNDLDVAAGGVVFSGNSAGSLFRLDGGGEGGSLDLRKPVLVDNVLSGELVVAGTATIVGLVDATIAGNAIGATGIVRTAGDFSLQRSILWQPGKTSLVRTGSGISTVAQVIASEPTSLGGGPEAVSAEPRFIDPARGDYRLRAASHAIDYTAPVAGDDRDAHGLPRDQRIDQVPRTAQRIRDLGAYERPALQPLVLNANFDADLNLWPLQQPDVASWDPTQNASGAAGSGSAKVSATSPTVRLVALAQCLHVPGPGTYALNGWGRSGFAATRLERDGVLLHWEYRRDGSEACNAGPATASGDHFLTAVNAWSRPSTPALIEVPEAEWNHESSISIYLVMSDSGVAVPFQMTGWFDGITLEAGGRGDLLVDGFEEP